MASPRSVGGDVRRPFDAVVNIVSPRPLRKPLVGAWGVCILKSSVFLTRFHASRVDVAIVACVVHRARRDESGESRWPILGRPAEITLAIIGGVACRVSRKKGRTQNRPRVNGQAPRGATAKGGRESHPQRLCRMPVVSNEQWGGWGSRKTSAIDVRGRRRSSSSF